MLGLLYTGTPKPWILSSLTSSFAFHHQYHHSKIASASASNSSVFRRFLAKSGDRPSLQPEAAVSVWHDIFPAADGIGDWRRDCLIPAAGMGDHYPRQRGEGSWNVAWDARPARWTHRLDLACLLLGVCCSLAPVGWDKVQPPESEPEPEPERETDDVKGGEEVVGGDADNRGGGISASKANIADYRVTGVLADGRCLFRAVSHGACLQRGIKSLDENRQTELADDLRARVVQELLKRREESEWFIEGDFDEYVKSIEKPYVWGGEPELLMASHVLKTPIAVYTRDRKSGELANIANYGEEYEEEKELSIKVLFHGYGHYDILEAPSSQSCEKEDF